MRSGMFGKLMAVLLAIMLVLPVAAQADDMNNGYTDITVSNLVVNYAGTEFDFSGIDLTLLAGVDAENRNALGGVMVKLTDSGNGAGLFSATAVFLSRKGAILFRAGPFYPPT